MQDQALSLLTSGRRVLVDIGAARYAARLRRAASGSAVALDFLDSVPADFPAAGESVELVVPVLHSGWRFRMTVIQPPTPQCTTGLFQLPGQGEQHAGRSAPRADLLLPIRCRVGSTETRWLATYALDLSAHGIRIAYPGELNGTSLLDIELSGPDGVLNGRGSVVWQRPLVPEANDPMYMMGLRLDWLTEAARYRVGQLVHEAIRRTRVDEV